MKKITLALTVVAALSGTAFAADLPIKAPFYKAPTVVLYNWTGCYGGFNIGWKNGRFQDESVSVPTTTTTFPVVGPQTAVADNIALDPLNADSAAVGGQVGCRWQAASNWVFGIEGDADWTDLHGTITNRGTGPGLTFIPGDTVDNRARWEASARGIFGRAFDKLLIYGTGGIAFTQVSMGGNFIATVSNAIPFPASAGSDSQVLVGGTIGVGFAYALSKNWDIGSEYRYTLYQGRDFGLGQVAGSCGPVGNVIACVNQNATGHKSLETNELLFKLNYHFNSAGPLVAKY